MSYGDSNHKRFGFKMLKDNGFHKIVYVFLIIFVGFVKSVKLSTGSAPSHGKNVVCYLGTWSVYRPERGSFKIENIDPNLCTHVVYAFVGLDASNNTLRSIDPYYDLEENYGKGSFKKMTQLKSKYPHLKVLLAVGGWNEGSYNYSVMAASYNTRESFINSAFDYVTKYNFDGFDLDWEFPAKRGGRPEDKSNFVLLIKELKEKLKKRNLLLTAAVGAGPDTIDIAYDVPEISKYLDLIHFMCYDYHGAWDKIVGPNAPLKSNDNLNIEHSVKYLLKLGAPPEKIVLGIPAYGQTFLAESNRVDIGMGSPALEPGHEGPFTKQKGFRGFNEICMEFAKNKGWSIYWDENSSTPFAINGNHVISYDDERSITEKVKLGMRYKLGGFMLWSIDTDDFHGDCENERERNHHHGPNSNHYTFPLLRTINRAIYEYVDDGNAIDDITDNEIHETSTKKSSGNLALPSAFVTVIYFFLYLFQ